MKSNLEELIQKVFRRSIEKEKILHKKNQEHHLAEQERRRKLIRALAEEKRNTQIKGLTIQRYDQHANMLRNNFQRLKTHGLLNQAFGKSKVLQQASTYWRPPEGQIQVDMAYLHLLLQVFD